MSKPESQNSGSDIVVFQIISDSVCSECGEELFKGRLLRMEGDSPLCLSCADLAHLVYLPRGDAALTRRASKYSKLKAVILRFSRSRKRYERQGILVEEAALIRAEQECLADADARSRARERRAEREAVFDKQYRTDFAQHVRKHYPGCPAGEADVIAEHACLKYSGRVGRTATAKEFAREAIDLAVRARIRHAHTRYDDLLANGWMRYDARAKVELEVNRIIEKWLDSS